MRLLFILIGFCSFCATAFAQLPSIYVERYYIADSLDASDTMGGELAEGATTYRVFVALQPESKLLAVYGDSLHPLTFSSSLPFFNNIDGATFGYQIPKVAYESNTVALDSYLTLGQTGFQGAFKFFGVPKHHDTNGSFIGGLNNDGGSEAVPGGLLVNDTSACGIPITIQDGMDTSSMELTNWFNFGIIDFQTGIDTSIFGFGNAQTVFYSQNAVLSNSGLAALRPDTNHVLIAQLTTLGELSFKINLIVSELENGNYVTRKYVATNAIESPDEQFLATLNYPPQCGCLNPDFLEYSADYVCEVEGACMTPIVLGCMDSLACNFDPTANVNLSETCCYPGNCFGRDIEEVCPHLKGNSFDFSVYPNPFDDYTTIHVISGVSTNLKIEVLNQHGTPLYTSSIENAPLNYIVQIGDEVPTPGVYFVRVITDFDQQHKLLVRL